MILYDRKGWKLAQTMISKIQGIKTKTKLLKLTILKLIIVLCDKDVNSDYEDERRFKILCHVYY